MEQFIYPTVGNIRGRSFTTHIRFRFPRLHSACWWWKGNISNMMESSRTSCVKWISRNWQRFSHCYVCTCVYSYLISCVWHNNHILFNIRIFVAFVVGFAIRFSTFPSNVIFLLTVVKLNDNTSVRLQSIWFISLCYLRKVGW